MNKVIFLIAAMSILFTAFAGSAAFADIMILTDNGANVNRDKVYIIDAGHGGQDGGANINGEHLEKELNLSVAKKLNDLMTVLGYETVMTRDRDTSLGGGKPGHVKMADLSYRLELAESYQNGIFISIHMNKFPQESCRGMTVYYSPNHPLSEALARSIRSANISLLQKDNKRELKSSTSAIYLLNRMTIPSVLVECGFISNPEEVRLLEDDSYQKKLSLVIFTGLISGEAQG